MKNQILITGLFLLLTSIANAQQNKIRLIVRGDDMGYSHSGNEALNTLLKKVH